MAMRWSSCGPPRAVVASVTAAQQPRCSPCSRSAAASACLQERRIGSWKHHSTAAASDLLNLRADDDKARGGNPSHKQCHPTIDCLLTLSSGPHSLDRPTSATMSGLGAGGQHPWLQIPCISQPYGSTKCPSKDARNVCHQMLLFPSHEDGGDTAWKRSSPVAAVAVVRPVMLDMCLSPKTPCYLKPPPPSVSPPEAPNDRHRHCTIIAIQQDCHMTSRTRQRDFLREPSPSLASMLFRSSSCATLLV